MQRNFELTQELLKAKESQKVLERIFMMFIGNFGGHIGSQDMLMNIFPHLYRQNRELIAPPPMSADSDSHRFENHS